MEKKRIAVIGASGYTGAELVRLVSSHPRLEISALVADRKAGLEMREVFPGFRHLRLPRLRSLEDLDLSGVDLVFCALPHATSQAVIKSLPESMKIVDLSADFRLRDPEEYLRWYGQPHAAPELQKDAVYGLTEYYREEIGSARLVACTGCNSATGLYALMPLAESRIVDPEEIIIDLKTGVSGAGRSPKEGTLHSEVSEGFQAYSVAVHRHLAEFDQELSRAFGAPVRVTFVPHLLPQNRGILATVYVRGETAKVYETLRRRYSREPFIHVLPEGEHPSTRHVRGSNYVHIGVVADRRDGRTIVFSALDNLAKGSSGQAIQNANLMLDLPETAGLESRRCFLDRMAGLRKRQRLALIAAASACLVAATALFGFAFRDGIAYFRSPAEVYEDAPGPEELFRVGGLVEAGSVERLTKGIIGFSVTDGEASLKVRFEGIPPDLFAEGQGVIALGRYSGGVFNATQILAKHDETYMPKEVADALKERGLFKPEAME